MMNNYINRITDLSSISELRKEISQILVLKHYQKNEELEILFRFLTAAEMEAKGKGSCLFDNKDLNSDDLIKLDKKIKYLIYRVLSENLDDETLVLFEELNNAGISLFVFATYIKYMSIESEDVVITLANIYEGIGDIKSKIILLCTSLNFLVEQRNVRFELLKEYLKLEMMDEAEELIRESIEKDEGFKTFLEGL